MSDDNRVWDTALDLVLYGPLGLALTARDEIPGIARDLADRGREELGRRRAGAGQQLRNAHAVGRFAVATGGPRLREKIRSRVGPASPAAPLGSAAGDGAARSGAPGVTGAGPAARPADGAAGHVPREEVPAHDVPDVELLAIPDYDELSASQVVQRLAGLSGDELDAVRRYESAQRARQTILGRIAQLSG